MPAEPPASPGRGGGQDRCCTSCGARPARPYLPWDACVEHTPARMALRPDRVPDPSRTLDALRRRAGVAFMFVAGDTRLIDDRAVASGRRRAGPARYAETRGRLDPGGAWDG